MAVDFGRVRLILKSEVRRHLSGVGELLPFKLSDNYALGEAAFLLREISLRICLLWQCGLRISIKKLAGL